MRDAQTFLEASRVANDALMGMYFLRIARDRGGSADPLCIEKIDRGIELLEMILLALEAREKQEAISPEALSILYVLLQGRMVGGPNSLRKMLKNSILELQDLKKGEIEASEEAEELLEIIARSASEEALRAASKVRVFMAETK